MTLFKFALLAIVIAATQNASLGFENGDTCGVTSKDFMNYDYRSDYMVAGEAGCTLGDESGCFCAPNLQDGQSLGEWQWQCNHVVNFGPNPATSKICPETVPVPKGLGMLSAVGQRRNLQTQTAENSAGAKGNDVVSVGSESQLQKMGVQCDTSVNPTGQPGDEVCPYSDCDDGGDHSAICACIDLKKYGMGEGMEWVCMHATCDCGGGNGEEEPQKTKQNGLEIDEEGTVGEVTSVVSSAAPSTCATFVFSLPISIIAAVVMFN